VRPNRQRVPGRIPAIVATERLDQHALVDSTDGMTCTDRGRRVHSISNFLSLLALRVARDERQELVQRDGEITPGLRCACGRVRRRDIRARLIRPLTQKDQLPSIVLAGRYGRAFSVSQSGRISTYPSVPCTRVRCPSGISRVASTTPTTAGEPHSRAITAPWVISLRLDRDQSDGHDQPGDQRRDGDPGGGAVEGQQVVEGRHDGDGRHHPQYSPCDHAARGRGLTPDLSP
jgi:hypothetical protein